MGWYPSFLAPLLAGTLLANLPTGLPPKAGLALIVVQAGGAYAAFIFASLLHHAPIVHFGVTGLIVFLCFANIARGRGFLPLLLILIAFATVPIVTMVLPQQAGALPLAFVRAMIIAVVAVWTVHVLWPQTAKAQPPAAKPPLASPITVAAIGTSIVLPMMLVFLMYGITDALPLLITTIMLVINFDPRRGAAQGAVMVLGNFFGGMIAIAAFTLLRIAPNLAALGLILLLVAIVFAARIERGGPGGMVALMTFNQAMVMFSLALVPGGADTGLWSTRVFQFAVASAFAVGMMTLLLPRRPAG